MANAWGHPAAIARVAGGPEAPCLYGTVKFYPAQAGVLVVADVHGLPKRGGGVFGFHIHEGTDCAGEHFSDTGGHYNPSGAPHPEHPGDLPPLLSCGGRAFLAVLTDRFRLPEVLGRTVVIHAMPDDFRTQPSGDSGEKIACGKIGKR